MVSEGWYIPTPDPKGRTRFPRWVLRISDTHVYYSKGGEHHYFCQRGTFERWVKRYDASPSAKGSDL